MNDANWVTAPVAVPELLPPIVLDVPPVPEGELLALVELAAPGLLHAPNASRNTNQGHEDLLPNLSFIPATARDGTR